MNKLLKILLGLMLCLSMSACSKSNESTNGDTTSEEESEYFEEDEVVDDEKSNALTDTSWTTDIGEDYGAVVQGDQDETLTTLSLYFDNTHASNMVGDISFDYKLNDDGTLELSNVDLGDTHITNFELYMEDGHLMMHARINGGNATLQFEQE